MFVEQKVKGCSFCNDEDIRFGEFIILEISGETATLLCTSHALDEDNVGEQFIAELSDIEPLDPNQEITGEIILRNMKTTGVSAVTPKVKTLTAKTLLALDLI